MHVKETIYHWWRKSTQKYFPDNEFKKVTLGFIKWSMTILGEDIMSTSWGMMPSKER